MRLIMGLFVFLCVGGCATTQGGQRASSGQEVSKEEHACVKCAAGERGEVAWCDHCGRGYVDGEKVDCKKCFVAKSEASGDEPCVDCLNGDNEANCDDCEGEICKHCLTMKDVGADEACDQCKGKGGNDSDVCECCAEEKTCDNKESCESCLRKKSKG
jgi:hypothetical protein